MGLNASPLRRAWERKRASRAFLEVRLALLKAVSAEVRGLARSGGTRSGGWASYWLDD